MADVRQPSSAAPLSTAELNALAEAAVLAPSADNRHSFELRVHSDRIVLSGDARHRAAPYHRQILDRISFGAAVENMTARARQLGYVTDIRWLPDPTDPMQTAELGFRKGEADDRLAGALAARHTNRRLRFAGPSLDAGTLESLARLVAEIDGVRLHFFDQGTQRALLLRLVKIAETARFGTRELHRDLFASVRFDVGWNASAAEGLPPAALGIEPGLRRAFALLRHWPLARTLSGIGAHHVLGMRAGYLPCRLAPHRGVFTTTLPVDRGALAVGVALERIWLEATRLGLALQPLAGAGLLALPDYSAPPSSVAEDLRRGWKMLVDATPLIVFRLGRATSQRIRTSRRPSKDYWRA